MASPPLQTSQQQPHSQSSEQSRRKSAETNANTPDTPTNSPTSVSLSGELASSCELANVAELREQLARRELEIDFLKLQLSRFRSTIEQSGDCNSVSDELKNLASLQKLLAAGQQPTQQHSPQEKQFSFAELEGRTLRSVLEEYSVGDASSRDKPDSSFHMPKLVDVDSRADSQGRVHQDRPQSPNASAAELLFGASSSSLRSQRAADCLSRLSLNSQFASQSQQTPQQQATFCDILSDSRDAATGRSASSKPDSYSAKASQLANFSMSATRLSRQNSQQENPASLQQLQHPQQQKQVSVSDFSSAFAAAIASSTASGDNFLTSLSDAALSNLSQLAALQDSACESQQSRPLNVHPSSPNPNLAASQQHLQARQRPSDLSLLGPLKSADAKLSQQPKFIGEHSSNSLYNNDAMMHSLSQSQTPHSPYAQLHEDNHHQHEILFSSSTRNPMSALNQQHPQHRLVPGDGLNSSTANLGYTPSPLSSGVGSSIAGSSRGCCSSAMMLGTAQQQHQHQLNAQISAGSSPNFISPMPTLRRQLYISPNACDKLAGMVGAANQSSPSSAISSPMGPATSSPRMSSPTSGFASPLLNVKQSQLRLNNMQIKHKFGHLGQGVNQFNSPHGFCLGLDQEIIVADTNNHRICIFDKNGTFVKQFGNPGKEDGQLWNPRKVVIMPPPPSNSTIDWYDEPLFVVCDRGAERSRMQLFTKDGVYVKKIPLGFIDIVAGLAITRNGSIAAVDSVQPTVYIISVETAALGYWFDCSDHMKEPSDIAVKIDTVPSSNGRLKQSRSEFFICDFKGHCVVVFSEEGRCLRKIGHEFLTAYPNGIDISDDGDILVGDSHGNRFHVVVFDKNGNFVSQFECPHVKVSRCCGLKITREGYIVTLAKNNHHVLVLDTIHI